MSQQHPAGASGRAQAVPSFPDLPEATVARLPEYLRALHNLAEAGNDTVSSEGLAAAAGVNSAKLRKDLSQLGSYGTRGVGYDVALLIGQIENVLGTGDTSGFRQAEISMTLAGVSFGLSREQRAKIEGQAQSMAIERFKGKAAELAKDFGFSGYSLREVAVNANDQGFVPRQRMLASEAKSAQAEMPVPVEPGKSSVVVTVSGSVQLR